MHLSPGPLCTFIHFAVRPEVMGQESTLSSESVLFTDDMVIQRSDSSKDHEDHNISKFWLQDTSNSRGLPSKRRDNPSAGTGT